MLSPVICSALNWSLQGCLLSSFLPHKQASVSTLRIFICCSFQATVCLFLCCTTSNLAMFHVVQDCWTWSGSHRWWIWKKKETWSKTGLSPVTRSGQAVEVIHPSLHFLSPLVRRSRSWVESQLSKREGNIRSARQVTTNKEACKESEQYSEFVFQKWDS